MKNNKYIFIIFINLFLSLLIVYISPRFDIFTLFYFIISNIILYIFLMLNEFYQRKKIKNEINNLFDLLYSVDMNINNYEVIDDEFGRLRDEIVKIFSERKILSDEAIKNEQILKEYTEDIAHQLKTPLTGILLMLDLMEYDEKNKKEYIYRIRNSTNRLHQLVDILLKLAVLDANMVKMKKDVVSVKEILFEVIAELETFFIDINFKVPVFGDDFILNCDRRWTYEAFFNIIKNGMEASIKNGVKIYLNETNVYKSVIVEDFSNGISDEALKKIYKRFYKENKTSTGYGIGLPMAKTIIEKQDGELLYFRGEKSNFFEIRFYN